MNAPKLALALVIALSSAARGESAAVAEKSKVNPLYLPYGKPGQLVRLANGETIHIKCMGSGSPTVVLTAGSGDWSLVWNKVQPQVAKTTRACAWDRPGIGFSSGSKRPQTVANRTADLEAALKAAHINGPYVAVGHSLDGYESLLFKDHNPKAVRGMVLVDPSVPDQAERLGKTAPAVVNYWNESTSRFSRLLAACLVGLKDGSVKLGGPDPNGCLGFPPDYPPNLAAALATRDANPLRFTAFISMKDNSDRDGAFVVDAKRDYGAMPLIVLTAGKAVPLPVDTLKAVREEMPRMMKEFSRAHDDLAALSSRGVNRTIAKSTHYIQNDQPQAVIEAVNEVVAEVRSTGGPGKYQ